jgi:hypothetical protein
MPDVGPLPEPLNSSPVDPEKHWSVLDQTKAEFKASGRSGVVIIISGEQEYHDKLKRFLIPFQTNWEYNPKKPFFVIQHDTQAKELFDKIIAAGLTAELVIAEKK